jgi:hypothetical protein
MKQELIPEYAGLRIRDSEKGEACPFLQPRIHSTADKEFHSDADWRTLHGRFDPICALCQQTPSKNYITR